MIKEAFYRSLPVPLQHFACSVYGAKQRSVRMGSGFWSRYNWLRESESWSRQAIAEYQNEQVYRTVRHAFETVPYYRAVMEERGLVPADITSREDLKKLPILEKAEVFQHQERLLSRAVPPGDLLRKRTSGTTGTALSFFSTRTAESFRCAIWWRHRARFGIRPDTWHVNLSGRPAVAPGQKKPPYWRWNAPLKQAVISMHQITPSKISHIVSFINRRKFGFFIGYPSMLTVLASQMLSSNLKFTRPPTATFLGAENIGAHQRHTIEEATSAPTSCHYGFAEGCGMASECERGYYHEDWEIGVLDVTEGERSGNASVKGSIVATGFVNSAFPFIRYRVGDVGVWPGGLFSCPCGRMSNVLLAVDGRDEDYVLTPEGARIRRFDYLFKDTSTVEEAQVVQYEPGSVIIRLVPRPGFSTRHAQAIQSRLHEWISPTLGVEFELLASIPRSRSGKFRPVVSELASERKRREARQ